MFASQSQNRTPTLEDIQRMLGEFPGTTQGPTPSLIGARGPEPSAAAGMLAGLIPQTAPALGGGSPMAGAPLEPQQSQGEMGGMFANRKAAPPLRSVGSVAGVGAPADPSQSAAPVSLLDQPDGLPPIRADLNMTPVNLGAAPHPKFFQHGGLGGRLLKGLGEFGLQYTAGMGNPASMAIIQNRLLQQRQQQAWAHEDAAHRQDHDWDTQSAAAKARLPEYFMSGRDRVAFDPVSGTSKVVYDGPSDAQDYADALGLKPGTPEYSTAVSDFVLKGNGATAFQNKTNFEGVRQDDRESLEGIRQGNRASLRSMPTYANLHPQAHQSRGGSGAGSAAPRTLQGVVAPIVAKLARGAALTPAEQSVYNDYKSLGHGAGRGRAPATGGGMPAAGGVPDGTIIHNPQTGHSMKRQGGAWVDVK